jgi:site-specific DNA-methyltransferase (adenine-specific)
MSYLISIASREGNLVLDPFCGSGTACLAAKILNRHFIGIEREPDYCKIAKTRIATPQYNSKQKKLL